MGLNDGFPYSPLTTATQTRVIVLAPWKDDEPIHCLHLTIDLDADWELTGEQRHSWPPPGPKAAYDLEATTDDGKRQGFTVPEARLHPEGEKGLHPFQRYAALSYVWGDQSSPHKIFLNGEPFYVGHNLHVALDRLRLHEATVGVGPETARDAASVHERPQEGRVLWIDAMCINQADIAEREAQVKLMGRIYKQADHVYADLGDTGEVGGWGLLQLIEAILKAGEACEARDSRQLCSPSSQPQGYFHRDQEDLRIVSALRTEIDNFEHRGATGSRPVDLPSPATPNLEDHGIPPANDPAWALWRQLLSSPYFQRLWIVQEFALAKTIDLSFADVTIDATVLSSCVSALDMYSLNRVFYAVSNDSPEAAAGDAAGVVGFLDLGVQRGQVQDPEQFRAGASYLLDKLIHARAAAATDPRDKIYGVLGLASDGPDFHHLVSYSTSVEAVYGDVARCLVEKGHGLKMLYHIDSRVSRTLDLPTWVPDWSRSLDESSIVYNEPWAISGAPSKAGLPGMQCLDSKLLVDAVLIDTISHMSVPLRHSSMRCTFIDMLRFLVAGYRLLMEREPPIEGVLALEVLFHALLCGCEGSKSPAMITGLRRGMFAVIGHMHSVASRQGPRNSAWVPHMHDFLKDGLQNAMGRRWCITEGGNLGLAPGGAKSGDRYAMFRGGPFPFIVRPLNEAEDTEYALIGHGHLKYLGQRGTFNEESAEYRRIALV